MDNTEVRKALRDLMTSADRSAMARLRELYPDIEAAQRAGVSLTAILAVLNERGGFQLSLKTLKTMLYRIRRSKKGTPVAGAAHPSAVVAPLTEKAPAEAAINSPESASDPPTNPFLKLTEKLPGDVRRDEVQYSPIPDKSKIYGDDPT
jgi:hypothetical protein